MNTTIPSRTPIQFDSTDELRKQLKILITRERIPNRTLLFCDLLKSSKYADEYPELVKAATDAEQVFAGKNA